MTTDENEDERPPLEYMSFNGFGRSPMVYGVPYMFGLFILCASLLPALALGTFVHGAGWLFALLALPLVFFARNMCLTDDKALEILGKEIKWALIKRMGGNARLYGGTFTMSPVSYGRKKINVERSIKASVRG